mmetsp:Transcript_13171/g.35481  ORF Transcript_13171/g.35481 Transcript_13171/m.35481 type:complete len:97 (+) Transcript_13171:459-749(+)
MAWYLGKLTVPEDQSVPPNLPAVQPALNSTERRDIAKLTLRLCFSIAFPRVQKQLGSRSAQTSLATKKQSRETKSRFTRGFHAACAPLLFLSDATC